MYHCAYLLKDLMQYPDFKLSANLTDLLPDSIVYLGEDFFVYRDTLTQKENIFSDLSVEWMKFCNSNLNFPIPALKLHSLNKNFKWRPSTGPFRFLSVEQAMFYDAHGYVVIKDVFNEAAIKEITDEIDHFESQVERSLREMDGGKGFIGRADEITFSTHLVKRSKVLHQFCGSKVFQDIAHDLIGGNVRLYWDHAVYKKPGSQKSFPWHQDNGYTFLEPQQYLTCWVALTDADENNGCFWTTPGMHKLGTLEHELTDLGHICYRKTPDTAISLPIKKGGLIIMSALLPHMTGPNYTNVTRKGYVIQFATDGSYTRTPDIDNNEVHTLANTPNRQYIILQDKVIS